MYFVSREAGISDRLDLGYERESRMTPKVLGLYHLKDRRSCLQRRGKDL